jgi:Protein of unknown function (DUF3619)
MKQPMSTDDQEFEQRVRSALDSSVTTLDADTRRRLAMGRARALDRTSFLARWLPVSNWVPATALAGCAVLAVTLFVAHRQPDTPTLVAQTDPDVALEILLGSGDGQEADSDPDFYIVMDVMMNDEDRKNAG